MDVLINNMLSYGIITAFMKNIKLQIIFDFQKTVQKRAHTSEIYVIF